MNLSTHRPVLLHQVIEYLDPKPGKFIIDGTVNGGGHAVEILKMILPNGKLLGVDWDNELFNKFKSIVRCLPGTETKSLVQNRMSNVILVQDNYANLPGILTQKNLPKADGLLLDLGFSSEQLEDSRRGFSFERDEPIIMTYNKNQKPVYQILKEIRETDLAKIIREFGGERMSKRIARVIKENIKKIKTSRELAEAIKKAVPRNYERGRIHPATRTFQALRIYANNELGNLENALKNLPQILKPQGRAVIISFHSLEDKLVKNFFRNYERQKILRILTAKPIRPSENEIKQNPRSRSARLRAAIKELS